MTNKELTTREELEDQLEELLWEKEQELARLDSIKAQVEEARRKAAITGDYSDSDWYNRAEGAQRACSRNVQKINHDISAINRKLKRLNIEESDSEYRRFRIAAHRLLDADTFQRIVDEAAKDKEKP